MVNRPTPTDAVKRFGLGNSEWLRPKPKSFFFAEFELNQAIKADAQLGVDSVTQNRLPLMVRTIDRPQFDLETEVYNQYNRPRVVHHKLKYQTVRAIFYDDVENTALKVFNRYRSFYYGDFQGKEKETSWNYDTIGGFEQSPGSQNWGLSTLNNLDNENSYFFRSLNIYEFYNDQFTLFNLIHPKITQFEMDPRDISEEAISEITVTLEYEGVTHQHPTIGQGVDLINYPMNQEIADKIGVQFTGDGSVRLSPPARILSDWNAERELGTIQNILDSRNPAATVGSTVSNRILPPVLRNTQLPNTWNQAVNQTAVLSGSRNAGVVNKLTRLARSIFG